MPFTQSINDNQIVKPGRKTSLSLAISMALALPTITQAATFNVTEPLDDGTGLVANTLSWAILQANTTLGDDVIELNTDVSITGVMKRLIDSNTTLQSDVSRRSIDGNNQFRPLFIKSGQVSIEGLDIDNGLAQGGASISGGAGAGLGGGMFIYSGHVSLKQLNFSNNSAQGGVVGTGGRYGGGGMFGTGNFYAGGGLFAIPFGNQASGGYGGYGYYQTKQTPKFGEGGSYQGAAPQGDGGFGGGGAYSYDDVGTLGGFGGGGGFAYNDYSPQFFGGNGGFGAGGGLNFYAPSNDGIAGFGGSGQYAAGLGGAIFIRSGQVLIEDIQFDNNTAISSGTADGFGGAVFIQHTTNQSNGNNQGMPEQTPSFFGCSTDFFNNTADSDPDTTTNNDNWFDLANTILSISGESITDNCLGDQEILVTGKGTEIISTDTTPHTVDGTDFGEVMANFRPRIATFKIINSGSSLLVLNGIERVELVNNDSEKFSIIEIPNSEFLQSNESMEFKIAFTPTQWVKHSATVIIKSNDPDESVYYFDISGQGIPYSHMIFNNGFETINEN